MGFLRRGKRGLTDKSHIKCRPIDFPSWIPSRGEQARRVGRFDLAVLVHRDGCWRLISEGPANQCETLAALPALESDDGKAPQRSNAPGFGDLDGCWSMQRFGHPEAAIQIRHPRQIALVRVQVPAPEPAHGFSGRAEPVDRK